MKAIVNDAACIGCGACQGIAPAVFEIGDDGIAEVKNVEITTEMEEEVKDAADGCPTDAIEITEK